MTGLVPMHEHRRVVERCEHLEAENDWLRSQLGTFTDDRRVAVREALGVYAAEAKMLISLADRSPRLVRSEALLLAGSSTGGRKVVDVGVYRLRAAIVRLGGPQGAIVNMRSEGYRLTTAALLWLRAKVPDAFPATKEPSR